MSKNIGNPPPQIQKIDPRLEDARLRPNEPGEDLRQNLKDQTITFNRSAAAQHAAASRIVVDDFLNTVTNEARRSPDHVVQKATSLQNVLRADIQSRNFSSLNRLPINKVESGQSQSSQRAKRLVSAANAGSLAAKEKPSVSTAVINSLARHAYLGEISLTCDRLLFGLDNPKNTSFSASSPLRKSLEEISKLSRTATNEERFIWSVKTALSHVDKFLLQNNNKKNNDINIVDQYLKGLFLANDGPICSRIASSSEMRKSISRTYNNPMISWKAWIAKEQPEDSSPNWTKAILAAEAIKAISAYVNEKIIDLDKYASKRFGTAENLALLSDIIIHEVNSGDVGRFLIAELKKDKNTSSHKLKKGDCIVVGTPSSSHVSKTAGKYSTSYADAVISGLSRYFK